MTCLSRPETPDRSTILAGLALAVGLALLIGCGGGGGGGGGGAGISPATGVLRGMVRPPELAAPSPRGQVVTVGGIEVFLEERPDLAARTDQDGRFAITGVPLGTAFRIVARVPGPAGTTSWLVRSEPVTAIDETAVIPGQEPAGVTLFLAAAVHGVVIDLRTPEGRVPVGARLTVWGLAFQEGPGGAFTSPFLPETATEATVLLEAPGYLPLRMTASFFPTATPLRLQVVLTPTGSTARPPVLVLAPVAPLVDPGAEITLSARVEDADDPQASNLLPVWRTTAGTLATGSDPWAVRWRAPAEVGLATVSVSVTDRSGLTAQAALGFAVGGGRLVVPRVATFTPAAAPPGRTLIITGTGFGPAPTAQSSVSLGSASAPITSWSDGEIRVVIPERAETGPVAVTTAGGRSVAGILQILDFPIEISPLYGPPQTVVTLRGFGFDAAAGTGTVRIGGATAPILLWSDRQISAQVPQFANTGPVTVTVHGHDRAAGSFTVSRIDRISPTTAVRGSEVTIEGAGFGDAQGSSGLAFPAGLAVDPTSWSDTRITAVIPIRATSGPLVVTIQGIPMTSPALTLTYTSVFTAVADFGEGRTSSRPQMPGVAVSPAGEIFGTDRTNSWIWRFLPDGTGNGRYGGLGAGNGQFTQPWGIAFDPAGNLFVADTGNDRIQKLDTDGNLLLAFGFRGGGPGELDTPTGLGVDADGNVYVADTSNHRIEKFDGGGAFLSSFGGPGTDNGLFDSPTAVAVASNGDLFVADTNNHRIQRLAADGSFIGWLGLDDLGNTGWHPAGTTRTGRKGTAVWQFQTPEGVAIGPAGELVVADTGNQRIQVLPADAVGARVVGMPGAGPGQLDLPIGIAIQGTDLYVAEAGNPRLQHLTATGVFVAEMVPDFSGMNTFPTRMAIDPERQVLYVVDTDDGAINVYTPDGVFLRRIGSHGTGDGQLHLPQGIALSPEGDLLVADTGNARIQRFDPAGKWLARFGAAGTGDGQFLGAQRVAVASSGQIFVADYDNHRVQRFDAQGGFEITIGRQGTGNGEFSNPNGVAVDPDGHLYVADQGNFRIQKFTTEGTFVGWWGHDADGFTGWHGTDTVALGAYGVGPGQFDTAIDVQVDPEGCVWVVDIGARRIQKFQPDQSQGEFGAHLGNLDLSQAPFGIAVNPADRIYLSEADGRIYRFAATLP